MKIGVNAQILSDAATGVARYAENMIEALVTTESLHSFVLFGGNVAKRPGVQIVVTSSGVNSSAKRILWEQFLLPQKARAEKVDLLYYPDHTAPLFFRPSKVVITVHDLAFLSMPETHRPGRRVYKAATFRRSAARADKIVAVSHSTLRECVHVAGIPEGKIAVIHNGVDPTLRKETNTQVLNAVRKRYGLSDRFILYVGTLERRKNLVRLIHAFTELKHAENIPHQLVLAGGPGFGFDEILEAGRSSPVSAEIAFPGFVRKEDLAALYSSADLLVYPSLYEGFGFPPLEAMACGCPVIVSNGTSLPEVVGDAGLMVDPLDTAGLSASMRRVITEEGLPEELMRRGYEQAKKFDWHTSARQLIGVFDSLA